MPGAGTVVASCTVSVPVPVPLAGVTRSQLAALPALHVMGVVPFCATINVCAGVDEIVVVPFLTAAKFNSPRLTLKRGPLGPATVTEISADGGLCSPLVL